MMSAVRVRERRCAASGGNVGRPSAKLLMGICAASGNSAERESSVGDLTGARGVAVGERVRLRVSAGGELLDDDGGGGDVKDGVEAVVPVSKDVEEVPSEEAMMEVVADGQSNASERAEASATRRTETGRGLIIPPDSGQMRCRRQSVEVVRGIGR